MIYSLILCGGSGSRLAPLSTPETPKQFLKLFSEDTLFTETINRMYSVCDGIIIVSTENMKQLIDDNIKSNHKNIEIILESEPKNTGPAVALGVEDLDDDDIVIMCPCDHYIVGAKYFYNSIQRAIDKAKQDYIVCLSVEPTVASSEFGYVNGSHFVEKPDQTYAEILIDSGHEWNSGIYIFRVGFFRKLLLENSPDVFNNANLKNYTKCPKISFDRMISEKTDKITNISGRFVWNDIGSFRGLYEVISGFNRLLETETRPWGNYKVLRDDDIYKMKELTVNANESISLQYHKHRTEIWYILDGSGEYINQENNDNIVPVKYNTGDVIKIPVGNIHKITANISTRIFEIQIGDYFGEDDIIRPEDKYGRIEDANWT